MAIDDLISRDWVLLPGTLCTGEVFSPMLDALGVAASRRREIVIGDPDPSDYQGALSAVSGGAVICGFSLGAIVAAHLADRLPAHRLFLFGLNPYPDDPAKAEGRREFAAEVHAQGGADVLARRLPPLNGPDPERARATILSMADRSADLIDAQTKLALTRPGALGALSRAAMPVRCFTGSADGMAPPEQGMAAARAAPSGRFSLLDGLGHYALLEDPVACAEAITTLEGLSS